MLLPTFELDLSGLPEDEQFPAWASHVANSRPSRLPPLTGPFRSHTKFWRLDPLLVSEQWMDPFAFERDEAMVRATPADHYSLAVILEGEIVFKRPDGDIVCRVGDAALTDLTRPELMHAARNHSVVIQVARWFLDRWPDIRSSDALEVVASEFGVQGLELDRVGLCWDADLIRGGRGWTARRFRGSAWTAAGAEAQANRINAFRYLRDVLIRVQTHPQSKIDDLLPWRWNG